MASRIPCNTPNPDRKNNMFSDMDRKAINWLLRVNKAAQRYRRNLTLQGVIYVICRFFLVFGRGEACKFFENGIEGCLAVEAGFEANRQDSIIQVLRIY